MDRGIVYILTNPCLDGWVKIGMTTRNNIEERLAELNRPPNIPLSFRAYAIYEVDNPKAVEKQIHSLFDIIDNSLHAREELPNGKIREREFFRISEERAFDVFKTISTLRDDEDCLKLVNPSAEQIEEEEIAESFKRRPNFRFSMLNIPIGSQLSFIYDENCICTTLDEGSKVSYDGGEYTLSGLARKLLKAKQGWSRTRTFAGPKYFTYRGKSLAYLRDAMENEDEDE